jgi:hypothetical protein
MPARKKQNNGTFWDDREGTRDGGCGVGKKNLSENLLQSILVREAATETSPADHLKLCLTRSWGSEAGVTYFIRCSPTTTCRGFGSGWSLLSSYVRTYECSRGVTWSLIRPQFETGVPTWFLITIMFDDECRYRLSFAATCHEHLAVSDYNESTKKHSSYPRVPLWLFIPRVSNIYPLFTVRQLATHYFFLFCFRFLHAEVANRQLPPPLHLKCHHVCLQFCMVLLKHRLPAGHLPNHT